ncbi:recombinase family protein [Mesorhizobium sp. ASY16-5R]|uniref:recombinase family protein n=1 Tax=Mesorhizobium sp. ASY16-5R TaxID=3445772 RepID=UPI003F9F4427
MGGKAVGFYWTLPVPWAGFTKLSGNIDEAARESLTIRFQVEAVRTFAAKNGYKLIREVAFLEIEPDRGSDLVREPLNKIETICRAENATLLYVDFSYVQGWRSHGPMNEWSRSTNILTEPVWTEPITIDGELFDPHKHFSDWRKRQHEWTDGKELRVARARACASELKSKGQKFKDIADTLNAKSIRSATGKPWTADNVRRLLQTAS